MTDLEAWRPALDAFYTAHDWSPSRPGDDLSRSQMLAGLRAALAVAPESDDGPEAWRAALNAFCAAVDWPTVPDDVPMTYQAGSVDALRAAREHQPCAD